MSLLFQLFSFAKRLPVSFQRIPLVLLFLFQSGELAHSDKVRRYVRNAVFEQQISRSILLVSPPKVCDYIYSKRRE